ncbi:hypothetical protein [Methylibium petroleiphilum]|uniref:Uncharacterized protein n=1 Tax=Methylibium petroleiphilum (strain ATCC BAA-1232 / LMG 22953 / PM1) TaxID=420662 RepID=A2SPA7_METPP|nr:hypothetical protein [Methylibium petroleiphilum]ABM97396.1 hypothetical protein Mpe_B0632 [Methylibium petroleiphilum PM1]
MSTDLFRVQPYLDACDGLAEGIRLFIRAGVNRAGLRPPRFAMVVLEPQMLGGLLRRAELCVDYSLGSTSVSVNPDALDENAFVASVEHWTLVNDNTGFWFAGDTEESGTVKTWIIEFSELLTALRQSKDPRPTLLSGTDPAWFGGALLYDLDDMEGMVEAVSSRFPELAARQAELEMARSIRATHLNQDAQSGAPARRRPSL